MTKDELKKQILARLVVQIETIKIGLEDEMTPVELERLKAAKEELIEEFYHPIGKADSQ